MNIETAARIIDAPDPHLAALVETKNANHELCLRGIAVVPATAGAAMADTSLYVCTNRKPCPLHTKEEVSSLTA